MPRYQKISPKIQELVFSSPKSRSSIRWLNIINPGKEELEYLRKLKKYDFKFSELRASSAHVQAERPIISKRDKYFFLILHFPVFKGNGIASTEIDFFLSHGFLVTLHDGSLKTLNDFFNTTRKDDSSMAIKESPSAAVLLGEILEKLINDCYSLLDKNSQAINGVEKMIFAGKQKESVAESLALERNIINIRRIMINHKNILKKMLLMKSSVISASEIRNFYSRLMEQTKRIWEISASQKETIDALQDANESLLNFHTNTVIRTLTVVSVIFAPLMFIISLLTMSVNKGMPLLETPNGFWIVSIGLAALAGILLLFFKGKKWL